MTRAEGKRKAIEERITWIQATSICRVTARHMRQLRERFEESRIDALRDRRTDKRQPARLDPKAVDELCRLKFEKYDDFSVRQKWQCGCSRHLYVAASVGSVRGRGRRH